MSATKASIITLPNKHLRQKSERVAVITDDVQQAIADMKAATLDWEDSRKHELGVALAAVQIDVMKKIIVIRADFENKKNRQFLTFINPEITKYEGGLEEDYEGCLSISNIYGRVPRYSKVRVRGLDENGVMQRVKAEGFLARVFQHEIDHINGKVFIDHIKNTPDAFFRLNNKGELDPLDYDTDIKANKNLWN